MFDDDGRVKVLDFGLAKLAEEVSADDATVTSDGHTQAGQMLGTLAYMSPEQAEGANVDHRSDIFSLGIVLYEMATGTQPFQGPTFVSTLSAILKDTPPPIVDRNKVLPAALGDIIDRCIAKDPGETVPVGGRTARPPERDPAATMSGIRRRTGLPGATCAGRACWFPSWCRSGPAGGWRMVGQRAQKVRWAREEVLPAIEALLDANAGDSERRQLGGLPARPAGQPVHPRRSPWTAAPRQLQPAP